MTPDKTIPITKPARLIIILLVALCSAFASVSAAVEHTDQLTSMLQGKTYFEPNKVIEARETNKLRKGPGCELIDESSCIPSSSSTSYSSNPHPITNPCNSGSSSDYSYSSQSDYRPSSSYSYPRSSSDSTISGRPPVFQVPWCPGQVMAFLVPKAMDFTYNWRLPGTCQQFANNFGGVSVLVGELAGPDFCSAGPSPSIYSNYTITRGMSVNEAIYARVVDKATGIEYAVAAGPILYPNGLVLYISLAKEVSRLPQVCS